MSLNSQGRLKKQNQKRIINALNTLFLWSIKEVQASHLLCTEDTFVIEEGDVKEEKPTIRTILNKMTVGPGPQELEIPKLVCRRLPKRDSIRTWRKPAAGITKKRKEKLHHDRGSYMSETQDHPLPGLL